MADTTLVNKYFFKRNAQDEWHDFATYFSGVRVLSIDGFLEEGDAVNVYNEQWIESNKEDFFVVGDKIIRKNGDLSMTLIISRRYTNLLIDEMSIYKNVKDTLLGNDFYIKSSYTGLRAHVVCNKSFKPTTTMLNRGDKSYILVTIPLHLLDAVSNYDPYYGGTIIGSLE